MANFGSSLDGALEQRNGVGKVALYLHGFPAESVGL